MPQPGLAIILPCGLLSGTLGELNRSGKLYWPLGSTFSVIVSVVTGDMRHGIPLMLTLPTEDTNPGGACSPVLNPARLGGSVVLR
jgi:hypothetical protein